MKKYRQPKPTRVEVSVEYFINIFIEQPSLYFACCLLIKRIMPVWLKNHTMQARICSLLVCVACNAISINQTPMQRLIE